MKLKNKKLKVEDWGTYNFLTKYKIDFMKDTIEKKTWSEQVEGSPFVENEK